MGLAQEVIDCGLAERTETGVRICGQDEQFAWLRQCSESGKKGGLAKAAIGLAGAKPMSSDRLAGAKPPSPSPSPSSDSSSDSQNKYVPGGSLTQPALVPETAPPDRDLNRKTWEEYRTAFVARYGYEPVRNAVVNSQISALGKRLGRDAPAVAKFYIAHNKSFYVSKQHTVGCLLADAEGLYIQWKRGRAVTENEARSADKSDGFRSQLERIAKGEL